MKREILFRGKRVDTPSSDGEWVDGYYYSNPTCGEDEKHFIIDSRGNDGIKFEYQIDPETVGQFTGLLDKNGVKIFEGDIVSPGDIEIEHIIDHNPNVTVTVGFTTYGWEGIELEVTGNIHD